MSPKERLCTGKRTCKPHVVRDPKRQQQISTAESGTRRRWQGWGSVCRGRLWARQNHVTTTKRDRERSQRDTPELREPPQNWGCGFVSKRSQFQLNPSLPVARGSAAFPFRPCRCPSQTIVWIFLGPPRFAKCFPLVYLLCLPLPMIF